MKWSPNLRDRKALVRAIHSAITEALCVESQSEPQLVANLVCSLPKEINGLSFSGAFTVQSGGVFVHGQPFVKCQSFPETSPASVEIGDLLLLRTEIYQGNVIDRRALLLQAKKVTSFPAAPDNANQHHLYAHWPPFEYTRSGALNGKYRHVTGMDLYQASRYLLIANQGCGHPRLMRSCRLLISGNYCSMTASPTLPKLSQYRCFIEEVLDFILGDAGKTFASPPPANSVDWDQVIKDLITETAVRVSTFVGRTPGSSTGARGQEVLFALSTGAELSTYGVAGEISSDSSVPAAPGDGPPKDPGESSEDSNRDGGISIIEFVVSDEGRSE